MPGYRAPTCPKCRGNGVLKACRHGKYKSHRLNKPELPTNDGRTVPSTTCWGGTETCPRCNGDGVIWIPAERMLDVTDVSGRNKPEKKKEKLC